MEASSITLWQTVTGDPEKLGSQVWSELHIFRRRALTDLFLPETQRTVGDESFPTRFPHLK